MAKRTGLVTAILIAHQLCRFLTRYRQSIIGATDDEEQAQHLIDAALAACTALTDYLLNFREVGP